MNRGDDMMVPRFLVDGGESGRRMRMFDWSSSALGEPGQWPAPLQTALGILLNSRHPMLIVWGTEHRCFCNDALGCATGLETGANAPGSRGRDIWPANWTAIEPMIDRVMAGASEHGDWQWPIRGHGHQEPAAWPCDCSPIFDELAPSGIGGVLLVGNQAAAQCAAAAMPDGDPASRNQTEHALERVMQRFQLALRNSRVSVFSQDRDLRYIWICNPAMGYMSEQVVGHTDRELFERPQDADITEAIKRDVLLTGAGRQQQVRIFQAGAQHHYDLRVEPLIEADGHVGGVTCAAIEITERLAIERELREERKRLGLALRAGQMGIYENDRVAGTLWWSPEMHSLFGVPGSFVPTRESFMALVLPEDREGFWRAYDTGFAPGRTFSHDFRIRRPDGEVRWIGNRALPTYDDTGRIVRHVGVAIDLTSIKAAEAALLAADRHKDMFIATLAHELRNPMSPIGTAALLLKRGDLPTERVAEFAAIIDRQVKQMNRLLEDLLDVARIGQGKLSLAMVRIELAPVLRHAIDMAMPSIDAGRHDLTIDLLSEPLFVLGDDARLAQVFCNLLVNAAKYTNTRGRIGIRLSKAKTQAVIEVEDNGIGLAAGQQQHIFKVFSQVEESRNRSAGGLGIGLATVKHVVELHGGTVEARSDGPGRGSLFIVSLPLFDKSA